MAGGSRWIAPEGVAHGCSWILVKFWGGFGLVPAENDPNELDLSSSKQGRAQLLPLEGILELLRQEEHIPGGEKPAPRGQRKPQYLRAAQTEALLAISRTETKRHVQLSPP